MQPTRRIAYIIGIVLILCVLVFVCQFNKGIYSQNRYPSDQAQTESPSNLTVSVKFEPSFATDEKFEKPAPKSGARVN